MKLFTYTHILDELGNPVTEWVTFEEFARREAEIKTITDQCTAAIQGMQESPRGKLKTFHYEDELTARTSPSIFLAGPTVRGSEQADLVSWRKEALDLFATAGYDGELIIPEFRRPRWDMNLTTKDILEWEYEGLCTADIIMFWIPRTERLIGLTTNHELGFWTARQPQKVVYGRPDDAYAVRYTDFMWNEVHSEIIPHIDSTIHTTLSETILAAIKKSKYENQV